MRYLKKFSLVRESHDFKNFSEMNLAYLLDDPQFELTVTDCSPNPDTWLYKIKLETDPIRRDQVWGSPGFDWDDIKDHYITFLEVLNDKSKIIGYSSEAHKFYDYQSVEIVYQQPRENNERGYIPYFKIVNIKDLDDLKLDNIWYICVYIDPEN